MSPLKRKLSVALVVLTVHLATVPPWAMADRNDKIPSPNGIAPPQTLLTREIKLTQTGRSSSFEYISKHKWWILSGLSVLVAGVMLSSGSNGNNSSNTIEGPEEGETDVTSGIKDTDEGDATGGFGSISAGW